MVKINKTKPSIEFEVDGSWWYLPLTPIPPDLQLVFEVDNPGTEVRIPLRFGVNVEIDWGDGVTTNHTASDPSHTYAEPGTYVVTAEGSAGQLGANLPGWNQHVTRVLHWSGLDITSMQEAFRGCQKLVEVPKALPSGVTNMNRMFQNSSFNGDISAWDTSSVTNMGYMFPDSSFNGDISAWDVSNVTDMRYMFYNSSFNGDISAWDVSSVTDMRYMFYNSSFNGDISAWDVSSVTDTQQMFRDSSFNGDISGWDTSSVTRMDQMFNNASNFSQDLSGWCVTNIPSKPIGFDTNSALQPHQLPIWGTCP